MNVQKATKVWIYARVAHPNVNELEAQIASLQQIAERKGFYVVGISSDTGSGLSMNRPGLQLMLQIARQRKIETVLITELSRLSRKEKDMLKIFRLFQKHHVQLTSVKDQPTADYMRLLESKKTKSDQER